MPKPGLLNIALENVFRRYPVVKMKGSKDEGGQRFFHKREVGDGGIEFQGDRILTAIEGNIGLANRAGRTKPPVVTIGGNHEIGNYEENNQKGNRFFIPWRGFPH